MRPRTGIVDWISVFFAAWFIATLATGCATAPVVEAAPPVEIRCAPSSYEKCAEKCAHEGRGDAAILENKREVNCICRKPPEDT